MKNNYLENEKELIFNAELYSDEKVDETKYKVESEEELVFNAELYSDEEVDESKYKVD